MRRIVIAVMSTLSALVLLLAYPTSTNRAAPPAIVALAAKDTTSAAAAGSPIAVAAQTFTGDAVDTRWGPVQVQIIVEGGLITSADAVVYPNENREDQRINSRAVPALNAEVVAAQSADIDMVSGATVTSGGYVTSLQQAIDQAFAGTA